MSSSQWSEVNLGDLFEQRKERGQEGLPTVSVTLNDGLIDRDQLERKTETTLEASEHLLVEPNDIVYNTMRMWQGASGIVSKRAIVSPAYVVAKPKHSIDPLYASYLFKTPRMIHLFWAYSHGLTDDRRRLYFEDFAAIRTNIPATSVQRRIAAILSTWDKAIDTTERLIANGQAQKKALLQQLVTRKRRLPGFSGDWRKTAFGDLASTVNTRVDPRVLHNHVRGVELEHIEAETGRLLGTSQANNQDSQKTPFKASNVLFGKLRPYLRKFAMPDFEGVCSTEIWVFEANSDLCTPGFLHLLVQSEIFQGAVDISSGSKMPRADWGIVQETQFHVPPINEQEGIVAVLNCASTLANKLIENLGVLHEEKSALLHQLVAGKRRVNPRSEKEGVA
jgi:type I restriction enzyme S subunit